MDASQSSRRVLLGLRRFVQLKRTLLGLSAIGLVVLAAPVARSQESASAKDHRSTAKAPAQQPMAGKLVICGGGKLPDQLGRRFIELAGGEAARLVVVTTASVLADTDRVETKLAFWRRQTVKALTILHTRSRERANDPAFAEPLQSATGVWFIGGNQNWLTETYLGTVTEKGIRGVLDRGGVVGGTSAGAAIMSPVMIRRDTPALEEGPGFGFLPGTVVDQHFLKRNRQARLLRVLDSHPDLVGIGIDEGTALVVEGARMSVMGESQVMVCSSTLPDQPAQVRPLAAGAEANLTSLRSEALARLSPRDDAPAASDTASAKTDSQGGNLSDATVSVNSADVESDSPMRRSGPMDERVGQ